MGNFCGLDGEGWRRYFMEKEKKSAVAKRKRALLSELRRLAKWRNNDVVKLAFLEREDLELLDGLDLAGLTELRRGANGVFEVKFVDRLQVLEQMKELMEKEEGKAMERLLDELRERPEGDEP
jgi:hypothetical protein